MQTVWLVIVVFFLILLIMPIFAKVHISYDLLHNLGAVSLYIFCIKILAYKVKFKGKNIILIKENKKKEIETKISDKQMRFFTQLSVQLKEKVVIRKLSVFSRVGVGDAFNSVMLMGTISVFINTILSMIKTNKPSARISYIPETAYNQNYFTVTLYCSFMITIFDIIYAIFMSLTIKKRSEKYERVW